MGASTTTGSGDSRNGKRNNALASPDKIKSSYTKLEPIRVIGSGSFGKYHYLLLLYFVCVYGAGWCLASVCDDPGVQAALSSLCVSYAAVIVFSFWQFASICL